MAQMIIRDKAVPQSLQLSFILLATEIPPLGVKPGQIGAALLQLTTEPNTIASHGQKVSYGRQE
jgi:hypothetical protein